MIPNPILKVLSILEKHRVSFLLMGGQACVLYGAAEFSRDMDVALLASPENLDRLRSAVEELEGEVIAIPPFENEYLERGHSVHFWCRAVVDGIRLDVMTRMRGVADFPELWTRRSIVALEEGTEVPLLSLPDLVAAKKTLGDKDWPMIRRLVEADYHQFFDQGPTLPQIRFWLQELRTPELLIEVVGHYPDLARKAAEHRAALAPAQTGDEEAVQQALDEEMARERAADRAYWAPLRQELEQLRWNRGGE